MLRNLTIALCLCLATACGPSSANTPGRPSPVVSGGVTPTATSPSPSPSPARAGAHVFVIVLENRSYDQAISSPYISSLASRYGVATNYHGVAHPSLPNYLAMTSGSTWGIADDGYHPLPSTGIGQQLTRAGVTWRAYMEGLAGSCFSSPYPYALKHDPFPYYGNRCPAELAPYSRFSSDMSAGDVPRFVWIGPGLCNDGHDCSNQVVDRWLSQAVSEIQATSAWQQDGVLLITWDEGEDSANHVLTLVIRPGAQHQASGRYYDHYSLLATMEDLLGVPRLGQAAQARPLNDLLLSGAVTSP